MLLWTLPSCELLNWHVFVPLTLSQRRKASALILSKLRTEESPLKSLIPDTLVQTWKGSISSDGHIQAHVSVASHSHFSSLSSHCLKQFPSSAASLFTLSHSFFSLRLVLPSCHRPTLSFTATHPLSADSKEHHFMVFCSWSCRRRHVRHSDGDRSGSCSLSAEETKAPQTWMGLGHMPSCVFSGWVRFSSSRHTAGSVSQK